MADDQIVDERIQDLPVASSVQSRDLFVIASAANGYNAMQASGEVVTAYVEATAGAYATQAQASATAAQQAQQSAAASAATATSASQEAAQTIDTIRGYATQAQEASQAASTAATNASSAQTAAEAAQTAAAASQSAAAQSATAAQSSAQSATTAQQGAEAAQAAAEQAAEQVQAIVAGNEAYTKHEATDRFALALRVTDGPAASLTIYPDAGSNIVITSQGFTEQAGSGDPSPINVRPITVGGIRLKKVVLNGSENWVASPLYNPDNHRFQLIIDDIQIPSSTTENFAGYSSNYKSLSTSNTWFGIEGISVNTSNYKLEILSLNYQTSSVEEWKRHLSENPLTVWYPTADGSGSLFTPEITEGADYYCQCLPLNDPLCKGDSISSSGAETHFKIVINKKISEMNNTESYPGWLIDRDTALLFVQDGFIGIPNASLCSAFPGIAVNASGAGQYVPLYIPTGYTGGLTQSQLIEQYPDLEVTMVFSLLKPETYTNPATPFISAPATDGSVAISGQIGVEMSATYNKSLARAFQELRTAIQALQTPAQPETEPTQPDTTPSEEVTT